MWSLAEKKITIEGTFNGLTYKGPKLDLKHNDPEEMQPQLKQSVRVKLFKLQDAADLEEYERVWQAISDGKAVMSMEDVKHNGGSEWTALLRWADLWYGPPLVLPEEKEDA